MFFIVLIFVLIGIIDLIPLLRTHRPKDVATWLTVFVLSFSIAVLLHLNVKVPSMMALVGDGLKSIGLSY